MELSAYKRKFKQLFDAIVKDATEISAYHLENILKHLDGSPDKCTGTILETPFFTELIIHALKNYNSASTSVKVFMLDIVTIVLRNEVHFNRFLCRGGFDMLVFKSETECRAMPTALHLAYVRQAASLVTHYSGLKYLVNDNYFRRLLRPYTHHRPPTLARALYDFMSKLIWKLNEYDEEEALLETLEFIVHPIMTIDFKSPASEGVQSEKVISDQIVTYIHTLVSVLGEIDQVNVPNKVVPILTRFGVVDSNITAILQETRDPAVAGLLAELSLRYRVAAARQAALRDPAAEGRANEDLNIAYDAIIGTLLKKRCISTVLDFICKCHVYLYKLEAVGTPLSFERFGRRFQLQNLFVIMLMVPLFTKSKAKQRLVDDRELQEGFETFSYGLAENIPRDIIKDAYSMRDLVSETGTLPACVCAVREVLKLRRLLSRRQAGVVFQALYYALSEYVLSDGAGALVLVHNPLRTPEDEQLVGCALDAIKMLLEEHDISWYESLEIINLQAALTNLIKQNILPIKLLVQVLGLMELSVRKLLSPELALLLRSERGGSLREAGAAARALLPRPEWRVRAAALELINSFTEVAYVKFTELRHVISEEALLAGAARAALGDPAPRARAAALRCLANAARCPCLWAELLSQYHNLYEQLVYITQHNVDGEVREEAANVLTNVYVHHKVSKTFTSCVSRVMARLAVHDPSARAQLAALDFWKKLIANLWTDRGMIDGTFPTVTFSKEKRKIITLTGEEIIKQIQGIIDDMSTTGSLYVLLKCMEQHNSVEVIESAYCVCKKIVGALDNYKFVNGVGAAGGSRAPAPDPADRIKVDQPDLISEIFECIDSDCTREEEAPVEVISPSKFLEIYKSTDYDAIIKSKKKASEAAELDTLIDEVISLCHCQSNNITEFTALL